VAALSRQFVGGAVAAGKPLSVRQRAVTFLQNELVPSTLEDMTLKEIPKNSAQALVWQTAFSTFVSTKSWDQSCKCFGGNQSEEENLAALRELDEAFSGFGSATSSLDLKQFLRDALEFRFPPSNAPKTTNVKDQALLLLLKFSGLSLDQRPEIKDLRSFWEQTFLSDAVELDIRKCPVGGTEKSIIAVRGQPCPGLAPTPSPTPQPSP
jgi:hypothetical protein